MMTSASFFLLVLSLVGAFRFWTGNQYHMTPSRNFNAACRQSTQIKSTLETTTGDRILPDQLVVSNDENVDPNQFIRTEILGIIFEIINQNTTGMPIEKVDPNLLLENSHILCKGRLFEQSMEVLLNVFANDNEKVTILQNVNAFLRGFIQAERKTRSRTKVNYILAGSTEGRLEEAIEKLADGDELDDDLITYLEFTIAQLKRKNGGMRSDSVAFDGTAAAVAATPPTDGYQPINPQENPALTVLNLVLKRIKAERTTQSQQELKLLAMLLKLAPADRIRAIESSLKRIEDINSFDEYVEEAIAFIKTNDSVCREAPGKEPVEISPEMLETLRDIKKDVNVLVNKLKTGYEDGSVYQRSDIVGPPSDS